MVVLPTIGAGAPWNSLVEILVKLLSEKDRALHGVAAQLQPRRLEHGIARGHLQLEAAAQLLASFDYRRVLERGFVLVRSAAGQPVLTAAAVAPGAALTLQFADAAITAVAAGRPPTAAPKPSDAAGRKQGSLF